MEQQTRVICTEEKTFPAHDKAIRDLIFVSPTILATGSYDNDYAIKLWDVPSFELLQKLIGHKGKIRNLQYSEKLRILASSGDDCTVILWKRLNRSKWVHLKTIPGKEFLTWGILIDDARHYLMIGCSNYIEIFNIRKGFNKIKSIQIRKEHVYGHYVVYSILRYDDKRILSADNEKIIFWNYIRGQKLTDINAHSHYIYRLRMFTYLNTQYILSSSEDKSLKFWKLNTIENSSAYKLEALGTTNFDIAVTGLTVLSEYGLIGLGLSSGIEGRGRILLMDCRDKKKVIDWVFDDIGNIGCLCVAWEPKNKYFVSGFWNGKIKFLKLDIQV